MNKIISLALSLAFALFVLAGCGGAQSAGNDSVKTGLGVVSSIASSTDAVDKDGLAQVDSVVAAVTVGKDGKIVKCVIDSVQTKINFNNAGKITTDLKTEVETKQELGATYGMKKYSGIGKEWNEQADAFAKYCVGKTINQIKGIAVNEKGAPTDKELTSSVTISVGDFIAAVEKAVKNAQDLGAKADDKLGLGIYTDISNSKDAATVDGKAQDGVAEAYSYYTATTFDTSGKVTSSVIDASQIDVNFNASGKITTDKKSSFQTKNERGANYGMAKSSKIGKEWNEQAAAFAKYCVGKTVDQIKGIAVNEKTAPTDKELTSSVTISVGGFKTVIEKAAKLAR